MSSFYIERTTKDKNTSEQIIQKSEHQEEIKNIHNRINKNKKSTSMWNKTTYDGGTWTKEKMKKVTLMISHQSWAKIVKKKTSKNTTPPPSTQAKEHLLKLPYQH